MNYTNEIVSHHFPLPAATLHHFPQRQFAPAHPLDLHAPVLTQFGDVVDVRKRGALRIMRMAGTQQGRELDTPAVVRVWHDDQCRELTAGQARALANQLLAAADLVDSQNQRV